MSQKSSGSRSTKRSHNSSGSKKRKTSGRKRASSRSDSPKKGGSQSRAPKGSSRTTKSTKKEKPTLRWVPLGGLGEIGRNMMFFEYDDEIIIIDAGLQFPEEDTPGIDYIIPNTEYLEENKDKIKALIITHGHYDHIGAIPYILGKIGNPPLYCGALSREIIKKRQAEFPNAAKPNFEMVKPGDGMRLGKHFSVGFFGVAHNIPDGVGMIIQTPVGKIVHPGEFKFDYDKAGKPKDLDLWDKVGKKGIHTLLLDSTNAEVPGYSVSERVVEEELEKLFKRCEGRIIVGTFASLLDRIHEIIKIAHKLGRKVAISGYSMKTNIEIARQLGYMDLPKGVIIPLDSINKYPDEKILIMCTGAQGEPNASLMRIANGEHRQITIKKNDAVVFSSSVIPGNEPSVQILKDNLSRQGAAIYNSSMMDIHSSGHAPAEELKDVMRMVNPRFFIPIHGHYFMRHVNRQNAIEVGIPAENIPLADNGDVVAITKDSVEVTNETVPSHYVMVDGLGVGDVGEVVLRDRKMLSQDGMVVIIATMDRKSGKLLKNPDIISRGFIYIRDNKDLMDDMRKRIKKYINKIPRNQQIDADYLKNMIREQMGQFLYNKTKRRPMILPVIIEI